MEKPKNLLLNHSFGTFIWTEKEPEPIPNFLKSKIPEKDDFYTNFEKLRQRMNEAKKAALKGRIQTQHTHTLYAIDSKF